MFHSITYGELSKADLFEIIADKVRGRENEFALTVGTDSQSFKRYSKVVTVIALHHIGKGGIFFYSLERKTKFRDLRTKIYDETLRSLDLSKELLHFLFEVKIDLEIIVHVDIGMKGRTRDMIQEIVGYVTAEGFACKVKPDSNTASTIADMISK